MYLIVKLYFYSYSGIVDFDQQYSSLELYCLYFHVEIGSVEKTLVLPFQEKKYKNKNKTQNSNKEDYIVTTLKLLQVLFFFDVLIPSGQKFKQNMCITKGGL